MDTKTEEKRLKALSRAEWFDAWRIAPRLVVIVYGALVAFLTFWFVQIKTYPKTECQTDLLIKLLDRGMTPEAAESIACTIVAVVGGPTTATTAFVTTICGLGTGIFAFYASTGRDWSKGIMPWSWGKTKKERQETAELEQQAQREEIKRQIDEL